MGEKLKPGVEFSLVGIENQDKIHYGMPVRVMNLDAYAYNKQWKRLKKKVQGSKRYDRGRIPFTYEERR